MLNNKKNPKPKKPLDKFGDYAKYSIMGFQMAAIIALGFWGGISLDNYFKTKLPGFTIVLSLSSVIVAIYWVVKDLIKKK